MGNEGFWKTIFKIFLVLDIFCLDPDLYRFGLDPDLYQSSVWIRIRNEFFQILGPDPYQHDTDPHSATLN